MSHLLSLEKFLIFVMSVRPSVRPSVRVYQRGSDWTNFRQNPENDDYFNEDLSKKIQIWLKSVKVSGNLHEDLSTFFL